MTAHQVVLEHRQLIVADMNVRELAETCGDAINDPIVIHDGLDHGTRFRHLFCRLRAQRYTTPIEGNFMNIFESERLAVDQQGFHIV